MGNASDARYGRVSGRAWMEFVRYVLQVKGTTCHLCGRPGADSVDHPVPLSKGGHPKTLGNAEPAHLACNLARGNLDLAEWFRRHPLRVQLTPSREW